MFYDLFHFSKFSIVTTTIFHYDRLHQGIRCVIVLLFACIYLGRVWFTTKRTLMTGWPFDVMHSLRGLASSTEFRLLNSHRLRVRRLWILSVGLSCSASPICLDKQEVSISSFPISNTSQRSVSPWSLDAQSKPIQFAIPTLYSSEKSLLDAYSAHTIISRHPTLSHDGLNWGWFIPRRAPPTALYPSKYLDSED